MNDAPACDHAVDLNNGVVSYPDTIVWVSDCHLGCCSIYRCVLCDETFTVEFPD